MRKCLNYLIMGDENKRQKEIKAIKKGITVLPKHLKNIGGSLSGITELHSPEDVRLSYLLKKYK